MRRLLVFLKPFLGKTLLSILLGAAAVASGIGLIATSAYLISAAALHPSIAELQVAIVGVRFFGISRGVLRYLERLVSHEVNLGLLANLRTWFYRKIEPLAPARLQNRHSGDLLNRAVENIESLEDFYVRGFSPPLVALVITAGMAIFLGQFHPGLAWSLLGIMLTAGVALPACFRWLGRGPGKTLVAARAQLEPLLVDGIQGMPDLLAFNRRESWLLEMDDKSRAVLAAQKRVTTLAAWNAALSSLAGSLGMGLLLVVGIILVRQEALAGVYLAMVVLGGLASFEVIPPLGLAGQNLERNLQAGARLFDIADLAPAVTDIPHPAPLPTGRSLSARGLSFQYEADLPPALADINFDLPAGRKVAIVGPGGSGKSTLGRLLLRFWQTEEGALYLDGVDLRQLSQEAVRTCFSVISQNTMLFETSLRENLLLARPGASDEQLTAALQAARLDPETLPGGLDTQVGGHGLRLSGGERQRVAIARALLKDAPVLLLDEPTAGLDAVNEQAFLRLLHEVSGEKTVLLITHRLVNLDQMDEIWVFSGGRLIQRGTETELLAQDGLYRQMWSIQRGEMQD
ncbi:MAG TPA: thiol reductant ABC exporter subunit CydC [Anaerolineaceae bacterium]|nr:thiol reductant ABC exporter subunit CydC [Anaerolineaceae bacterium]HPN53759.1 thiol reductant ABC exporter subunit CydC [Anaerolineaceae bacterium]